MNILKSKILINPTKQIDLLYKLRFVSNINGSIWLKRLIINDDTAKVLDDLDFISNLIAHETFPGKEILIGYKDLMENGITQIQQGKKWKPTLVEQIRNHLEEFDD